MKFRWTFILTLVLMTACGKQIPDDVIEPEKMETVLYDYHLAMGMSSTLKNAEKEAYKNYVFKKHGISEADFDSSMVWYTREAKTLSSIYDKLNKRFTREYQHVQMKLDNREESSSMQFESGDSINIWKRADVAWLTESPLHHLLTFELKPDTTFRLGDSFLWEADFHFTMKGRVMMGLNMLGESGNVEGKTLQVDSSGHYAIRLHTDTAFQIKTLNGFVFVPKDTAGHTHVLVHNLAMTRYHAKDSVIVKKEETPQPKKEIVKKPINGKKIEPLLVTPESPERVTPSLKRRKRDVKEQPLTVGKE